MSPKEIVSVLNDHQWKFAKTAKYSNPHWYTLRETWQDDPLFDVIVQSIRDHSHTEYFWRKPYQILLYKGWKYWSMGAPIDETILINRAFDSGQYNDIAWNYDDLFSGDDYIKEDKEVVDMIFSLITDNNKDYKFYDIGCGTGLFLDFCDIKKENYIGLDPSWSMIKIAREKHPNHKFLIDRLETYRTFHLKDNAIVISLFGSMNYVLPAYLDRVREYGERYFLMFYKEDYDPITYDMIGKKLYHYKHNKEKLQVIYNEATVIEYNNYYIVSNL